MSCNVRLGSLEWKTIVINGAMDLGIEISAEQAEQFAVHARDMMQWNRKVNLTTITDPFEMAVKHYLDSITAVPLIKPGSSLLDIGSGAGFPGIPLKIVIPSLSVTLADARRKRVNYLKQVIRSLNISHIQARHERLERMADALPAEDGFDMVVCRAFSDLKLFALHAFPLLKEGGALIAYKGRQGDKIEAEIEGLMNIMAVKHGDGCWGQEGLQPHVEIRQFKLPYLEIERTLIIMRDAPANERGRHS